MPCRNYGKPAGGGQLSAKADQTVFREAVPLVTSDEATTVPESGDARQSSTDKNGTFAVAAGARPSSPWAIRGSFRRTQRHSPTTNDLLETSRRS